MLIGLLALRTFKMKIADFCNYDYLLENPLSDAFAIGWLDPMSEFPKKIPEPEFLCKLKLLYKTEHIKNFKINKTRGFYFCQKCRESGIKISGSFEIMIPRVGGGFFIFPELMLHYIDVHFYNPGEEFVNSILILNMSGEFDAEQQFLSLLNRK